MYMKTKLVYAVVSTNKDYYLEQTLVSVISAKYHTPNATIILVVDELTDATLEGYRSSILDYISEKIVIKVPSKFTKAQRSRFLKTTLRKYIKGDYLFIDSDTVITDNLSDIDLVLNKSEDIAAVKDSHCRFNQMILYKLILSRAKKIGWDKYINNDDIHFNSGVMFVRDSILAHKFYEIWHDNWLIETEHGFYYDQLAMAYTNHIMNYPIKEMEGIWNCQIRQDGLRYLNKSKIIHYFGDTGEGRPYYFCNTSVFINIKNTGNISSKEMEYIKNGKEAFVGHNILCGNEDVDYIFSSIRTLYIRNRTLYIIVNLLAKIINRFLSAKKL